MNREQMIEVLVPAIARSGEAMTPARRRLWQMSTAALERELQLRGLLEYEDPPQCDDDDDADDGALAHSLGLPLDPD